jgi:hydroxymethylbilane synthase
VSASRPLVVGTRASALALAQTGMVCDALRARHPGREIRVERITTTGDARAEAPLAQLGRGAFVTEIETALRERRIDFAVHSAKDLPSTVADDLTIPAFLPRADARDVLVSRHGGFAQLPPGARVGTSSPRRICLVRALRPDLVTVEMRGNVDTRLRKLAAGEFDAIVLAAAGLARLGRSGEATEAFDVERLIPCVGQGALAVEARRGDAELVSLLAPLDDSTTRAAVECERAFLAELGAGCRAAAAAHARVHAGELQLLAMIGSTDGRLVRAERRGSVVDGPGVGVALAHELLLAGGAAYLAEGAVSALRGKRIAVTRPEGRADALGALLEARGAIPVPCPTIAIRAVGETAALDRDLQRLDAVQWLVFTSMNAVTAVADRMAALDTVMPRRTRVAAVGRATASLVARHFGRVDFVPARSTADALGEELPARQGDVVLFPKASLASDALGRLLRERGAVMREVVAYETVPAADAGRLAALVREGAVDAVVFTSPSSVTFAAGIGDAMRALGGDAPIALSMGPSTTRAAADAGIAADEPPTQTVGALVETLERLFTQPMVAHG